MFLPISSLNQERRQDLVRGGGGEHFVKGFVNRTRSDELNNLQLLVEKRHPPEKPRNLGRQPRKAERGRAGKRAVDSRDQSAVSKGPHQKPNARERDASGWGLLERRSQ